MTNSILQSTTDRPRLLISVRNADEAAEAMLGGADIIDVKEPSRGPLGSADREVVEQVLSCVNGRLPVSVAAGELIEWVARPESAKGVGARVPASPRPSKTLGVPPGVLWVKFGLSGYAHDRKWIARFAQMHSHLPSGAQIVPVIYADWQTAQAPAPDVVLQVAQDQSCPVVLVDTFDKKVGGLFDVWDFIVVEKFVAASHDIGTAVALAGGLREESFALAVAAGADVIGVRGAVCDAGRCGKLNRTRVERLLQNLICATSAAVGN